MVKKCFFDLEEFPMPLANNMEAIWAVSVTPGNLGQALYSIIKIKIKKGLKGLFCVFSCSNGIHFNCQKVSVRVHIKKKPVYQCVGMPL